MALIDLGELRDEPGRAVAPTRPPRTVDRPLRVALALALLVSTMAAAAPVPDRTRIVVPAGPEAEAFLDGDRLYVVEQIEREPEGTVELTSYALPARRPADDPTPAPVWRTRIPAAGRLWQVQAGPGVVLFSVTGQQEGERTIALDAGTGQERWRQPGHPWWDATGILLMQSGGEEGGSLRAVDPPSGRARWSVPTRREGASYSVRAGLIERIVLATAQGRIEARDPRSGALLHTADLPLGELRGLGHAVVVRDLLLVNRPEVGALAAHGLDGLRQRWEVRLPPVDNVGECGNLLCVGWATGGIVALDPATGVVRWTVRGWAGVLSARGGRLLAFGSGDRFGVLDGATGRQVADLGVWQLMPWQDDDRLLALRGAGDGRGVVVAELDVVAGRARARDVLPHATSDCRGSGARVLCRLRTGGFGVWRYGG
ncbi:PQQ-binding-like beta-propeller repeat protein [Micromonospora sp. KLBMP9576]|uniref:outer membrane protein assembly factor BamB family protein n=1 Tax=Micromonospora sp. KLBMP9576 TaxID=3424769 RepID=UPI003D91052E